MSTLRCRYVRMRGVDAAIDTRCPDSQCLSQNKAKDDDGLDRGRKAWLVSQALPPPNRACGSPAHGSPVSGSPRRGLTDRLIGCQQREQPMRRKEGHVPPLTPLSRAVNMRSVHTDGSTQAHRARIGRSRLRSRLQGRQYHRGASVVINVSHPLSCIPSLHAHYRRFSTTMDALTPARVSLPVQVSVLHAHGQVVTIPSPTTRCSVVAPLARYPSGPRLARHASDTSLR